MDAGEVQVDPVHDEFFKMQDLADALVRESIQNSLDARRGRAAVRVRFRFGTGKDALPAAASRQYFGGLREHLDAVGASIHSTIPSEDANVPYLLIEDFGTRGLTGDPAIDPELEGNVETKNDFFYFWRNVGRSNKGEVDRGRWGLGKAVFSVASRIRTIFGLTRRADDQRALLLGQSVLKTHILDGVRKYPYGFFALYERRDGLPLPIENPLLLERFFDDFSLTRVEPGLSVVIPYFREDELSFEKIITSSIGQYFYPITKGDLTVEVQEGNRAETLNGKTITEIAFRYGGTESDGIERLCALARWSLTEAAATRITTAVPAAGAFKWSEELFGESLAPLRDRFESGERIAIRAPLTIKRKKGSAPARSYFDLYLEKDETLPRGEPHFIRRGITIPDVRNNVDKPVRVLVVIEDDALSTFLGDAENPAHSDWSERADKLRELYEHHTSPLRFVKNSAAKVASLLSKPPEGRMSHFLQEIFSIEVPEEAEQAAQSRGHREKPEGGDPGGDQIREYGTTSSITIGRAAGGFVVRGNGSDRLLGSTIKTEVAYRIHKGNPFLKYSPFDFDLTGSELEVETNGVEIRSTEPNGLIFAVSSPRFHVSIKGFDRRRDLMVRALEVPGDASETELH